MESQICLSSLYPPLTCLLIAPEPEKPKTEAAKVEPPKEPTTEPKKAAPAAAAAATTAKPEAPTEKPKAEAVKPRVGFREPAKGTAEPAKPAPVGAKAPAQPPAKVEVGYTHYNLHMPVDPWRQNEHFIPP